MPSHKNVKKQTGKEAPEKKPLVIKYDKDGNKIGDDGYAMTSVRKRMHTMFNVYFIWAVVAAVLGCLCTIFSYAQGAEYASWELVASGGNQFAGFDVSFLLRMEALMCLYTALTSLVAHFWGFRWFYDRQSETRLKVLLGFIVGGSIVSAILSATHNEYAHALGVLAIPGIISICILMYLRHRMPHPRLYEDEVAAAAAMDATVNASSKGAAANATASAAAMATTSATADTTTRDAKTRKGAGQEPSSLKLPARFWLYTGFCGLVLAGVATFGVLSYHMVSTHVTDDAIVPIIYAGAMAIDAVFAAITGVLYDKLGTKVLFALPLISAAIPWFAYSSDLGIILIGVLLWGASLGIQESTMRAAVSDMVPSDRRATSYGMFSVAIGIGSLIGGAMAGILYTISVPLLIGYTSVVEIVALALLAFIAKTRKVA